jgi:sodium/pantothenate symporter
MIIYLVANVVIGLVYGKKRDAASKANAENKYFIGGRGMNGLILAMTTMATYTSVSSFSSGPGAGGMTNGYTQVWVACVQIPCTFMVLGVLGNKMALVSRRTGSVTVSGILKARFKSDLLVIVTSLVMILMFIVQMISQFKGGANIIQAITGYDYVPALLIFAVVVIVYTSFGGFTAVVITDTIQGLVMTLGTFLLLFFSLKAANFSVAEINANLAERLPNAWNNLTGVFSPGALLSFWILVGFGTIGLPSTAVRAMGFKSTKNLHSAMWIGALVCGFVIGGMHLAGVWLGGAYDYQAAGITSSDLLVPFGTMAIMPPVLAGIFLAAPMAAVMSTVSSLLILASASLVKDLYRNYVVRDDAAKIAKYNQNVGKFSIVVTAIVGIITLILTINPPDVIWVLNLFAMGGQEVAFTFPLIGGIFWKKATKEGAVASAIGGFIVYVFCYYKVKVLGINAIVWGLLAAAILFFAVSKATYKNLDKEVEAQFF